MIDIYINYSHHKAITGILFFSQYILQLRFNVILHVYLPQCWFVLFLLASVQIFEKLAHVRNCYVIYIYMFDEYIKGCITVVHMTHYYPLCCLISIMLVDVMHYMMTSFNYILHSLVTAATAPTFYLPSDAYDIVFVTIVYTEVNL